MESEPSELSKLLLQRPTARYFHSPWGANRANHP